MPEVQKEQKQPEAKQAVSRGRAVVAGATGYLGGYVVQALHRDGWKVRALARDRSRIKPEVGDVCDDIFEGQATDAQTLEGLFEGCDVAFSSIGIRHFKRRPTYKEVDYQANLNLIEAAEKAGVKRFVFVSVLNGEQHREASPLIEAREQIVDRLRSSPMKATVLRPTGFFNDLGDIFQMAKRGKVWLIGDGESRINPIHGADLADVAAEALRCETPPESIDVGGPDTFSQRELAQLAFKILDKEGKTGKVPAGLIRGLGHVFQPFNANLGALTKMFALLGSHDAAGQAVGQHHIEDYFRELAA